MNMLNADRVFLTLPETVMKGSFIEYNVPNAFVCQPIDGGFPTLKRDTNDKIDNFSTVISAIFTEKNETDFHNRMLEVRTKSEVAVACVKFHLCTIDKNEGKAPVLLMKQQLALFNYTFSIDQLQNNDFSFQITFRPNTTTKSDKVPGGKQTLYAIKDGKSTVASLFYFDCQSFDVMEKCHTSWQEDAAKNII